MVLVYPYLSAALNVNYKPLHSYLHYAILFVTLFPPIS